mmetsp:Transcript_75788/g.214457  ORF Transcript_75788/g.214457 Transcript_75788/m.214457 type:complete len:209 (+) Transcript_75788:805-1431(+)
MPPGHRPATGRAARWPAGRRRWRRRRRRRLDLRPRDAAAAAGQGARGGPRRGAALPRQDLPRGPGLRRPPALQRRAGGRLHRPALLHGSHGERPAQAAEPRRHVSQADGPRDGRGGPGQPGHLCLSGRAAARELVRRRAEGEPGGHGGENQGRHRKGHPPGRRGKVEAQAPGLHERDAVPAGTEVSRRHRQGHGALHLDRERRQQERA